MPTALIPIANGSEELEAITMINLLRRANIEVTVASINDDTRITGARQVLITADALLEEVVEQPFDLIALPGGMPGASHLSDSQLLIERLRRQINEGLIGAICASPSVVLATHGLIKGKSAVCYPGFEEGLEQGQVTYTDQPVVIDGNLITSKGPGTAMAFGLALIEALSGQVTAREVADGLLTAI